MNRYGNYELKIHVYTVKFMLLIIIREISSTHMQIFHIFIVLEDLIECSEEIRAFNMSRGNKKCVNISTCKNIISIMLVETTLTTTLPAKCYQQYTHSL